MYPVMLATHPGVSFPLSCCRVGVVPPYSQPPPPHSSYKVTPCRPSAPDPPRCMFGQSWVLEPHPYWGLEDLSFNLPQLQQLSLLFLYILAHSGLGKAPFSWGARTQIRKQQACPLLQVPAQNTLRPGLRSFLQHFILVSRSTEPVRPEAGLEASSRVRPISLFPDVQTAHSLRGYSHYPALSLTTRWGDTGQA